MEQSELLRYVVAVIERLGVPYLVTGSVATIFFGEPRFTNDIDIIKKMEYYREGGSEKHLRDITGVLRISGDRVDYNYIAHWASRLGLEAVWQAVKDRPQQ